MTLAEFLSEAFSLIPDESHWSQEAMARTEEGAKIEPGSALACKFCATGALRKALYIWNLPEDLYDRAWELLSRFAQRLYNQSTIQDVNDFLGYPEVARCYQAAIICASY